MRVDPHGANRPQDWREGNPISWFQKKTWWMSAAVLVTAVLLISFGWKEESGWSAWDTKPLPSLSVEELQKVALGDAKSTKTKKAADPKQIVPILINQADLRAWQTVPGIGEKRAEQIVALRTQKGGTFRALEDLLEVKGIGPKTLEKMRPWLKLN